MGLIPCVLYGKKQMELQYRGKGAFHELLLEIIFFLIVFWTLHVIVSNLILILCSMQKSEQWLWQQVKLWLVGPISYLRILAAA